MSDIAIFIPSRIGSSRLTRKPLVKIGDKCLIEHVTMELVCGFPDNKIYVATDSQEIADVITQLGATAVMTATDCPTGSDRVYHALQQLPNHQNIKYVLNVQGDMPFISTSTINALINRIRQNDCDIATPVIKVTKDEVVGDSNVTVVVDHNWHAMYFSRNLIPYGSEEFLYHIGIYAFTVSALEKFIHLPPSKYELCEKLEQLRALENGMQIAICPVEAVPISVDTPSDLAKAQNYFARTKNITIDHQ